MQGHKHFSDKVITQFRLSERVPAHTFYRRLAELVDWGFYEETKGLYSHIGQLSLDPVVFFKLVLVGRLENLVSDRRLIEHCALRLDILYFLGYEVDEELPWHSTISSTRQLYPAAVFEYLFNHVFAQCVAAGLVAGDTQIVDSAPVKANASLYSLCEKQPLETFLPRMQLAAEAEPAAPSPPAAAVLGTPAHVLRRVANRQARHRTGHFGSERPRARLVSNKTHYSPADPEARISIKLGKARALNYHCSIAVDTAHGVIRHIQADLADSRDSVHLPQLVTHLYQRLLAQGLLLRDLVADTNYSNGVNYALLEQQGITPWIPVFGKYKPVVEGFTYEREQDRFTCPAGKLLPFKGYDKLRDGGLQKLYRAAHRDCRLCSRKSTCAPKTDKRQITRTAYDPHYQRALLRQQSPQGQRMRLLRQSTVEPVFGSLLQHYGLRQVNTRGRASAHKTMLLAAMAYNLKKLLKYQPNQRVGFIIALPKPPALPPAGLFRRKTRSHRLLKPRSNLTAGSSATVTMGFWTVLTAEHTCCPYSMIAAGVCECPILVTC